MSSGDKDWNIEGNAFDGNSHLKLSSSSGDNSSSVTWYSRCVEDVKNYKGKDLEEQEVIGLDDSLDEETPLAKAPRRNDNEPSPLKVQRPIYDPTPVSSNGQIFSCHNLQTMMTEEAIRHAYKKYKIPSRLSYILPNLSDRPNNPLTR